MCRATQHVPHSLVVRLCAQLVATPMMIVAGLHDSSALLRHEVAYCLGQRQDAASVQLLKDTLANPQEHPMYDLILRAAAVEHRHRVRHEAAEALGAIATDECLPPLQQHEHDACLEVAETCQLALERIHQARTAQSDATPAKYLSVDPAFAAPASTPVAALRTALLDESLPMSERYAAMFALRNKGGADAVQALGDAFGYLHFWFVVVFNNTPHIRCRSALLKHEVAYVLGQMQDAHAVAVLQRVLRASDENAMVRHEAAEALGSIASDECIGMLREYAGDAEPIVAHSCEVFVVHMLSVTIHRVHADCAGYAGV